MAVLAGKVHGHTARTDPWGCCSWQSHKLLPQGSEAWDMTCSSVSEGVKRAAGSDHPGSHPFATGSSACILLISLIQGARQGWCQLQCLERKGLPMKQMLYQHLKLPLNFLQSSCLL